MPTENLNFSGLPPAIENHTLIAGAQAHNTQGVVSLLPLDAEGGGPEISLW